MNSTLITKKYIFRTLALGGGGQVSAAVPPTSPMTYSVSGPAAGDVWASATFTVTLGVGTLSNPVTMTPSASNGDGAFSPSSVTLTDSIRTATFGYTPALWGFRNINVTNDGGLNNPARLDFVARVQVGSSGMAPSGNQSPNLGGFNVFSVGPWWQEMGRTVTSDAVAPDSMTLMKGMLIATTSNLGPVAISVGSRNVTGTGTHFTTDLAVGDLVTFGTSGTGPLADTYQVQSITSDTSLTLASTYQGSVTSDALIYRRFGLASATRGSTAVVGTGTHFTRDLSVGTTVYFGSVYTTPYIVASISDDKHLTLTAAYQGTTGSGLVVEASRSMRIDWTSRVGSTLYGIPYNVVPGTQPMLPVNLTIYPSESDTGPAPFYPAMSIENWYSAVGLPPTAEQVQGDAHGLVYMRDEATGGLSKLYETWKMSSPDGGATWAPYLATFDLATGTPRPEGWTSADAAGLPITPLLVNYNEAASGTINHPFRIAIGPAQASRFSVWPARHSPGGATTGLPMGARLRLSDAWYQANENNFSPMVQTILTAMRNYGLIVADLATAGIWLMGTSDDRWLDSDLNAMRMIPDMAFEVLDTIHSPIQFTGPASGAHGTSQQFAASYLVAADSNFSTILYLSYSTNGGASWTIADGKPINDSSRSVVLSFTPPSAGNYLVRARENNMYWIQPADLTFTAS